MDSDWDEAISTAIDLLREHGPLSADAWIDLLIQHDIDEELAFEIVEDSDHPGITLLNGTLAIVDDLLKHRHFTHRLTAVEIASDILFGEIDLRPLLSTTSVPLVDMDHDRAVFVERKVESAPDLPGIVLAPGTLASFQPGDLAEVTIRLTADPRDSGSRAHWLALEGRRQSLGLPLWDVQVAPVDTVADVDVTEAADEVLDRASDGVAYLQTLVWHLVVTKEFFTEPALPLSELIENAGYVIAGEFVVRAGTDVDAINLRQRASQTRVKYRFPSGHAAEVAVTIALLTGASESEQNALIAEKLDADPQYFAVLADARVPAPTVDVVFEQLNAARDRSDEEGEDAVIAGFRRAAAMLVRHTQGRAKGGALYLAARAAAVDGDLDAAESLLHDAVHADRDALAPQTMLAAFAILRDDFAKAHSILAGFGVFDDDFTMQVLREVLSEAGPEPGRNEPCWCGSGRKYKSCHRGKVQITEAQRGVLLQLKAAEFTAWSGRAGLIQILHGLRVSFLSDLGLDGDLLEELAENYELAIDITLFEGGVYADLLETARAYLSPDDIARLEGILHRGRSVFQIEDVEPGGGMTVRDLRDDTRYRIAEEHEGAALAPGVFICTRVEPQGAAFVAAVTPEPVAAHDAPLLAQALADGLPPIEVMTMLSARFTQSGAFIDDLAENGAHLAELRLTRPEPVEAWLDDALESVDDGWEIDDDGDIAGDIRLETVDGATQVRILAFSDEMLQSMITSITEVDADATLVNERHLTPDEVAADLDAAGEQKRPHLRLIDE